ncbi:hypothetical protein D018_2756B, partial [Vibrio parahaemolyticus VP2007-007]
TRDLVG